jgi:small subunit ribosomal protein S17
MPRTMIGKVTSDKTAKTIVVTVVTKKTHPIYKKQYSVSKKFMAHDEDSTARLGDLVEIIETKPMSARKRFKLVRVVEKARIVHTEAAESEEEKS